MLKSLINSNFKFKNETQIFIIFMIMNDDVFIETFLFTV